MFSMEKESGLTKAPVVFPFLIEEPKSSHQDAFNLTGLMTKWPEKQSRLIKDAFPPSKNVLHDRERSLKGLQFGHKDIETRGYSCPNIVDMSNIVFYNDRARQKRPRRIINGFFPNKIRSAQASVVNDRLSQSRGRNTAPSQVCECLCGLCLNYLHEKLEVYTLNATCIKHTGLSLDHVTLPPDSNLFNSESIVCRLEPHIRVDFSSRSTANNSIQNNFIYFMDNTKTPLSF